MNVSMLSRLSFPELENLRIEKKNSDCAEVVSRYSDMGTDRVEESLGVEAIGIEADPTVDFGWETNGGGCWILEDIMSKELEPCYIGEGKSCLCILSLIIVRK